MSDRAPNLPTDLSDVTDALERHRPTLDALECDVLKQRVLRSRTITSTSTKGTFMHSRSAITALLASGLLLSSGGTALGVTALQATTNPVIKQYGKPNVQPGPTLAGPTPPAAANPPSAAPGTPPVGPAPVAPPASDVGDVLAESGGGTDPAEEGSVAAESASGANPVQASRQVAAISGDSLPFTGYASIPVLLLGIGLLTVGLVARRRSAHI